jgi:hypothetical protein
MTKPVAGIEISNLKQFQKGIKNINQEYRKEVFLILSLALDHIRQVAADKYIISNVVGKRMSPWKMAKLQPSNPTRLTERTGRMLTMMKHNKKWEGIKGTLLQTTATAVQRTMGLRGRIVTQKAGRNINEAYEATISALISSGNPFIGRGFVGGGRIVAVIDGKPIRTEGRKETKATLRARFLHEHGVRGAVRQSFTPAAHEEDIRMQHLFNSRLSRILRVKEQYGRT